MKNNTQTGSPQESKTQHNGWKFFFLFLAVVLAAVGWFQLDSKPKILKQQERRSRLEELDRKADPYFNQARREVPKIAKILSSKKAMMKLCWLIAKDKATGKHEAEKYLAKHIKPMHQAAELDEHGKHLKLSTVQQAFDDLTNVWDVMFPVERYKFINEVVKQITVHIDRVEIEYKTDGLEAVITETEAANGKND